jgi:hypothetical protein
LGFLQGARGMGCEYLGRQIPELLVSSEVIAVSGIGQAVLGYGLKPPAPQQPLWVGGLFVVSGRYASWLSLAESTTGSTSCSPAFYGYGI